MHTPDQYKFVFLCGLHRSGTSPLFRMLKNHPQISGFSNTGVPEDEGQHLQTVFPAAKVYGGPGLFGFVPAAHLTEMSELVTDGNRQMLFDEWSRHWDLDRPFLLEKSPPNLIRTRFLKAIFPPSYFIVLVRHPIAVSLATMKWVDTGLESLVEHWLHCHRIFEEDRPHLERCMLVRYEDLIADSEETIRGIFRFIGLPVVAQTPLDPSGNEPYFEKWRAMQADPAQRPLCSRIAAKYEKEISRYQYDLLNPGRAVADAVSKS